MQELEMSYDASHEFYEQKILLAPIRLQEAGFIMRPETPEDGNCFLWALLDQIR